MRVKFQTVSNKNYQSSLTMATLDKKIVLVTGGTGLLGKGLQAVIEEERREGLPVVQDETWIFVGSKDADLLDGKQTRALFQKYKPTHVIHLAAKVGGVYSQLKNNLDYLRKNLYINDNILQTCYETGVEKLVSCLSTCVFPAKAPIPIDESMIYDGPPHPSIYGYSYSKRFTLVASKAYQAEYGKKFISVIPCNIFGPYDNFDTYDSHVIPGLIRKMHEAKLRGDKKYVMFGSGRARRQFIYSKDLAKIFIWTLREYDSLEPIIGAVDEEDEISVAEAATIIKDALDYDADIDFDATAGDGQLRKTASNKRLRSYLPDFQFTPFKVAIKETVDWYVQNQETARKDYRVSASV